MSRVLFENGDQGPELRAKWNGNFTRNSIGNVGAALGDSLVAGGATASTFGMAYPLWAQALSMGKMQIAEFQGFPGQRINAIATSGLATVLANPNVTWCVVGGGTNDFISGIAWDVAFNDYVTLLINPLLSAGICPILTTLPPTNTSGTPRVSTLKFNQAVRRFAAENKLPLVDPYLLLTDITNQQFKTAYFLDGVHPNNLGYYDWGVLLWQTMEPLLAANLPTTTGNTDSVNMLSGNSLFLTDAGADGIPDSWTAGGSTSGITHSLVAASAPILGNWAQVAASASAADRTLAFSAPGASVIPGNRIAICGFAEVSGYSSGLGLTVQVSFPGTSGTALYPIYRWRLNAMGFYYMEAVVPTGATGITKTLITHSGTVTAKFAAPTIFDLTALGF